MFVMFQGIGNLSTSAVTGSSVHQLACIAADNFIKVLDTEGETMLFVLNAHYLSLEKHVVFMQETTLFSHCNFILIFTCIFQSMRVHWSRLLKCMLYGVLNSAIQYQKT
jgi:hypothetical protein